MLDIYVLDLSPFAVQFTENFGIRWYGLAYLTGFVLAYAFTVFLSRRGAVLVSVEKAGDFITYAAIGTLVGGRLGYCLFYRPDLLWTFHGDFPFWGLLEVHRGGMASHGGLMGVIGACILFARREKLPAAHLVDLCTLGGSLGVFFGRIANFINGELYGREAQGVSWAVKFPREIETWGADHLNQLRGLGSAVEALGEIRTHYGETISATAATWSSWVSNFTFDSKMKIDAFKEALILATQNGNEKVIEAMAPVLTPRYPSQLIQAVLEGLLVFIVLFLLWRKPLKPGIILSVFGILYSVARIIGEQFRLPDAHIGYQALGLTRGQWLSIAMMAFVLIYMIYVIKRPAAKIPGWGKASGPPQ